MQLPISTFRGLYFPGGIPRINRAHRLAYGLCFVSLAQQGVAGFELLTGLAVNSISTSVTPPFRPASVGQALFFGNNADPSDAAKWPPTYSPIVTSNGSGTGDFAMLVVANPSASASQQNFLFCQINSATHEVMLAANVNASGSQVNGAFALLTYGGSFVGATASGAVDGNWHAFMGMRSGTTCSVWKDGAQLATGSGTAQQIHDNNTQIGYGGLIQDLTDARGANCGIGFCAAWNRALTPAEALEVGLDPGCFLLYPDGNDVDPNDGAIRGGSPARVTLRRRPRPGARQRRAARRRARRRLELLAGAGMARKRNESP